MTREELRDYVEEQRNLDIIPYHVYSTLIDGIDTLEQQPCEDAISREDAIKTAIEAADDWDGGCNLSRADIIEKAIKSLPSVQPKLTECDDAVEVINGVPSAQSERKKGKWINKKPRWIPSLSMTIHDAYECSNCGEPGVHWWKHCINCGARMIEPQESEMLKIKP